MQTCVDCGITSVFKPIQGRKGAQCLNCNPGDSKTYKAFLLRSSATTRPLCSVPFTLPRSTPFRHECLTCGCVESLSVSYVIGKIREGKHPCKACEQMRLKAHYKNLYTGSTPRHAQVAQAERLREYKSYLSRTKPNLDCLASTWSKSLLHKCLICNHEFSTSMYNVKSLCNGCRVCAGNSKKTKEAYQAELDAKPNNVYRVCEDYSGANVPILHACRTCETERRMSPSNCLRKYHDRCLVCHKRKGAFSARLLTMGDSKVLAQGYEHHGLKYLLKTNRIHNIEHSKGGNVPRIAYKDVHGKSRKHYPDFFLPKKNKIVEVKSIWTLGIVYTRVNVAKGKPNRDLWYDQVSKYMAAKEQGYDYLLLVFDNTGNRLDFPKDWYNFGYNEIKRHLKSQSPHLA